MSVARYEPGQLVEREMPAGARRLGVKVKPVLRLGMGVKHPEKGYPMKTDYLTVRGENARALAKFAEVYGDKPKAVDITLRPELNESLDIRYRAFGGGQHGDGGGMIKAVGHTNFALLDWMGGPDTLTVFGPDGVEEIDIEGEDDPRAKELGVELAMTFKFGLPKVLSYGAVAAISSRGSETIDTVWAKLREWHALAAWLQAPVSRVTGQPLLVLKPSSMMAPKIEGKGDAKRQAGWQKTQLWVLDLVLAETQDEMVARVMAERQRTLDAGGAAAMLYGPAGGGRREIEAARTPDPDDFDGYEPVEGEVVDDGTPEAPADDDGDGTPSDVADVDQQAAAGATPEAPASDAPAAAPGRRSRKKTDPDPDPEPEPEQAAFPIPDAVVDQAGETLVQPGWTVAATCVDKAGADYVRWALGPDYNGSLDDALVAAMRVYATARHPELVDEARS